MPENKTRRSDDLTVEILMTVMFLASPFITEAAESSAKKLNEDPIKCTPCLQRPPPPPASPSSPPPSSPSPPPPPKKPYCPSPPKESHFPPPPPPPPPPTYASPPPPPTYSSPPGNLYPVDHDFGAAAAGESFSVVKVFAFAVIIGFMIL